MFVKILLDIVVLAKNCSVMCPPVRPRVVWMRCVVQYSSTNRINTITECRSAAAAAGTHCACCSSAVVRRVVGHWVVPRHAARHYICYEIGHNEPLCATHSRVRIDETICTRHVRCLPVFVFAKTVEISFHGVVHTIDDELWMRYVWWH